MRGYIRSLKLSTLLVIPMLVLAISAACAPPPQATPSPQPSPTAAVPSPTKPPAPTLPAPTPTAAAPAAVVSVVARESDAGYVFDVDRVVVPAGKVTFVFKNSGKMTHELFVFPIQDLSGVLAKMRAGEKVDEEREIKGVAAVAEDVDPGKTVNVEAQLSPGWYELACFVKGKNPDGSTYVHYDKGQFFDIAVTGPGGPSPQVGQASNSVAIDMTGDEAGSWLFVPDRIVASAGKVTFRVTNHMKIRHELVVHKVGDLVGFKQLLLKGEHAEAHEELESLGAKELVEDLDPGKTVEATAELEPGVWVAACYLVSQNPDGSSFVHSDRGQHVTFVVK